MTKITAFLSALFYTALCFLGIPFTSPDLKSTDSKKIILSEKDTVLISEIFDSETKWISDIQLENGAIPMTTTDNGTVTVNPYFADISALALLEADDLYIEEVIAYMEWHFEHLNTAKTDYNGIDGTIYDYSITIKSNKIIEEKAIIKDGNGSYDSTDSYAATFLILLNKYFEATNDKDYIFSRKDDIKRVINAMYSTLHKGLTYAKPDYQIKYLMDNCEVYEGSLAAYNLISNAIIDEDKSFYDIMQTCLENAKKISRSIERKAWNRFGSYYQVALGKNNRSALSFSWDSYYPCATAQLFPIIHGLISPDSERAELLYSAFCEKYNWQHFDIPDNFYWGSNVYAAAVMNDTDRFMEYMNNYYPLTKDHEYPLYNADIARVALAAKLMLDKAN